MYSLLSATHSKSTAQIILRWNVQRNVSVISKSTKIGRIAENLNIFDFELTTEEVKKINYLSIYLFVFLFVHLLVYLFVAFIYLRINFLVLNHLFTYPSNHLFIHSLIHYQSFFRPCFFLRVDNFNRRSEQENKVQRSRLAMISYF